MHNGGSAGLARWLHACACALVSRCRLNMPALQANSSLALTESQWWTARALLSN